ncbi:MAG TPA: UvrD-helicase domain-containing protein [Turneriella sp.]|nr:UvrD-helicase domain-containing protein [Turneriella sp.]HNE18972.1 UvrD-helicase domain-containing protein [Turneriella sp.]HNL10056.1 UvrD-helicase domain-containing protein [Turneriella sp.]HNL55324.1 UvrD-helicase domain-containing protein [Turneriella sp.]
MLIAMDDWKNTILQNLNEPQQQAVQTTRGPLLILAGAGSGKTRTIIHRMAWLIHVEKVPAWQIAAVTFTNKAAEEMRTRLLNTAGPIASESTVRTFHSLGLFLLRRNAQFLNYPENFSIWDDTDQQQALSGILEKFDGKYTKVQYRYFANTISSFKDKLILPENLAEQVDLDQYEFGDILPEVYQLYEVKKSASLAVDFADLISLPCHLFEKHPELLERWQNRYPYWLIDEYQDTNYAQYRFVQHVAARDRNLCVVGDDDQAIYGWRGADVKNILDFSRDFKDATIIKLEENYRSTKVILDIANAVIENNFERMPKRLFTERQGGSAPVLCTTGDDVQEAAKVVGLVREALRENPPSEVAVLYRTNSQSRMLEEAMLNAKIPYRVYGGLSFFARKEIKDTLAYFRMIVNGKDEAAFARVINSPPRGIGEKSVEKIFGARELHGQADFVALLLDESMNPLSGKGREAAVKFARDINAFRKSVAAGTDLGFFLDELLDKTGLAKAWEEEDRLLGTGRMEYIGELRNSLLNYQRQSENAGLGDYLQQISLITTSAPDEEPGSEGAVSLMTVHNAKGLEFGTVVIAGFEKDLFPHFLAERDGDISEERRLFYVAVTRAKNKLFFTQAERRMRQGFYESSRISPFWNEIPEGMVTRERSQTFAPSGSAVRQSYIPRAPAAAKPAPKNPGFGAAIAPQARTAGNGYATGDKVSHSNFGRGRVLKIEGDGDSARIHIFFDDGKTRKFLLKFTELKKL